MQDILAELYHRFFHPGMVIAPVPLALAVAAAWLVYRRQRVAGGFWRWLVPARIWRHPSHLVDLQLFLMVQIMGVAGVLGALTLTVLVASGVAGLIPAPLLPAGVLGPVALALLLWLPSDFATYWVHRLYHRWAAIWPLHAVHHSAAVMTPITTYRQHPLAVVVTVVLQSGFVGLCQGLLIGTLTPEMQVAEIAGINLCIVLANAALAALHHSHVWLSYGPVLEHVFISPAQHQVHHSVDPRHHNRNFGNSLALWDWAFGTLYVIREREEITFGLTGETEKALMTQRLGPMLWDPLRRMVARPAKGRAPAPPPGG